MLYFEGTEELISIHALAKRATINLIRLFYTFHNFNPRPRKEGDFILAIRIIPAVYFNPRPRKEGDKIQR